MSNKSNNEAKVAKTTSQVNESVNIESLTKQVENLKKELADKEDSRARCFNYWKEYEEKVGILKALITVISDAGINTNDYMRGSAFIEKLVEAI